MVHSRDVQLRLEFDFDVLACDSYGVVGDISRCRCAKDAAGGDIEGGTVPRAGHFPAHDHSLGERPAPVGTGVVNGIERSINVEDRDESIADFDLRVVAGRDRVDRTDCDPSHRYIIPVCRRAASDIMS